MLANCIVGYSRKKMKNIANPRSSSGFHALANFVIKFESGVKSQPPKNKKERKNPLP